MQKLLIKPLSFKQNDESAYEFYIAVSSDQLVILEKKRSDYQLVEWIVSGADNNSTVFSAPNEDVFLDAISVIKEAILSGTNPLLILN
jgi:hypothetical protein